MTANDQQRFDNLQNELRRELAPQGFLEEEVFSMVVSSAWNRRYSLGGAREGRAFAAALREFHRVQDRRMKSMSVPTQPPPAANVIPFGRPRSRRSILPASA